jgi:hypothetical protein
MRNPLTRALLSGDSENWSETQAVACHLAMVFEAESG